MSGCPSISLHTAGVSFGLQSALQVLQDSSPSQIAFPQQSEIVKYSQAPAVHVAVIQVGRVPQSVTVLHDTASRAMVRGM